MSLVKVLVIFNLGFLEILGYNILILGFNCFNFIVNILECWNDLR